MALTISSPHATSTIASVSGATVTLSTGIADASWVGRAISLRRNANARGGQWREIVAVNSATEIEIQYPWRTDIDLYQFCG